MVKKLFFLIINVAFLYLIYINAASFDHYQTIPAKWKLKQSHGPLLYDISLTSASKFASQHREDLLYLHQLGGKKIYMPEGLDLEHFDLYFRIHCSITASKGLQKDGYKFFCPDITVYNDSVAKAVSESCSNAVPNLSDTLPLCEGHGLEYDVVLVSSNEIGSIGN